MKSSNVALLCCIIVAIILIAIVTTICVVPHILEKRRNERLLQIELSKMVDTADTTIKEVTCRDNSVSFYINGVDSKELLTDRLGYYKQRLDDELVKQHLKYVTSHELYKCHTESDKMTRAVIGASLESVIMESTVDKPNICLVYHAINYLYSEGYRRLLLNMVSRIIRQHEILGLKKYSPEYSDSSTDMKMVIKYDSKMLPNQLCIKVILRDSFEINVCGEIHSSVLSSNMELLISPTKSDDKVLQYSLKKDITSVVSDLFNVHAIENFVQSSCSMPTFFVKQRACSPERPSESKLCIPEEGVTTPYCTFDGITRMTH
ncbi:hypothetical protein [Ehrlichia ruminantium]|uniref:hypothetical protein n=1 Tax=Ehrlichia ruminantium TaxID=779 RepID=UPI0015DCE843|nr:hypothetical protein [Ehrlichia ruminantium]QLK57651.1 hypothetical protein FDZ59_01285 [Ehrlichia ruminantium]